MTKTKDELEQILAGEVSDYLAVAESGSRDEVTKCEGEMSSTLSYLLQRLLEDKDNLPYGFWIDDVLAGWYGISTFPNGLEFYGYAIRGTDDGRREWAAPAAVKLQVAPDGASLAKYRFDFGDRRRGLTRLPLGQHVKALEMNRPEEWMFTFTKGSSAK